MSPATWMRATYKKWLLSWIVYAVLLCGLMWLRGAFRVSMLGPMILGLLIGLVIWPVVDLARHGLRRRGRPQPR